MLAKAILSGRDWKQLSTQIPITCKHKNSAQITERMVHLNIAIIISTNGTINEIIKHSFLHIGAEHSNPTISLYTYIQSSSPP